MADPTMDSFTRAMALAAITGSRCALGPALLATSRNRPNAPAWMAAAAAEMVLDKAGILPSRFRPLLLIPRALAGAWVARESLREDGADEDATAAVIGAVVAAGVASLAPVVRQALHQGTGIHDALLGLAEDFIALRLGSQATGMSPQQIQDAAKHAALEVVSQVREQIQPTGGATLVAAHY